VSVRVTDRGTDHVADVDADHFDPNHLADHFDPNHLADHSDPDHLGLNGIADGVHDHCVNYPANPANCHTNPGGGGRR